ncbi:hypothetical protein Tco_1271794, partial [Tanacetum coccineum]
TKKTHSSKKSSSTPISKSADDIMVFRKELDALSLKHLGPIPTKAFTSTNPVNTGSGNLNTGNEQVSPGHIEAVSPSAHNVEEVFSDDDDDDEMPEMRIYDKSSEGIFEQASYDVDGVITDFNNLPDEICLHISPDEDKVIDVESLDHQYPIIEWQSFFLTTKPQHDQTKPDEDIYLNKVTRSNGHQRFFRTLMGVLSILDREDLKDKHPEGFDRMLWGDLMIMFNQGDTADF